MQALFSAENAWGCEEVNTKCHEYDETRINRHETGLNRH